MTELDKANGKERGTVTVDQDTLKEVSGGASNWKFVECPNCHELRYFIPYGRCRNCGYTGEI